MKAMLACIVLTSAPVAAVDYIKVAPDALEQEHAQIPIYAENLHEGENKNNFKQMVQDATLEVWWVRDTWSEGGLEHDTSALHFRDVILWSWEPGKPTGKRTELQTISIACETDSYTVMGAYPVQGGPINEKSFVEALRQIVRKED